MCPHHNLYPRPIYTASPHSSPPSPQAHLRAAPADIKDKRYEFKYVAGGTKILVQHEEVHIGHRQHVYGMGLDKMRESLIGIYSYCI